MVQSPSWEANWFVASQEIPRISRNPKVHYRTHKRPSPVTILDQPNPVHIPTSNLLEIQPNIPHLRLGLPNGLFSSRFPTKNLYTSPLLTHTRHMPSLSRSGFELCYTVIRHLKMGEISNYAEKNPLNTSSRPDNGETFPLLWSPKDLYRLNKSPLLTLS